MGKNIFGVIHMIQPVTIYSDVYNVSITLNKKLKLHLSNGMEMVEHNIEFLKFTVKRNHTTIYSGTIRLGRIDHASTLKIIRKDNYFFAEAVEKIS